MAKSREVIPSGEIIAKFDTYEAAVAHVEKLLNGNFPVRQIAIVGRGIRTVERVRTRIGYPRLAVVGMIQGAIFGAGFEYLMGGTVASQFASTMVTCAGIGALLNVVRYSMTRTKRSFSSMNQLIADTYEIQIPRDLKAAADDALLKSEPKTN